MTGSTRLDGVAIRVLIVDDDDIAAAAHAEYVRRIDGFAVAGVAHRLGEAAGLLAAGGIDLVLLDLTLPDGSGIELARRLRAVGQNVDIIAITAVRDIDVVRGALSLGVEQYLIKPFGFAVFRDRLLAHQERVERLSEAATMSQGAVDRVFTALGRSSVPTLPKGLSDASLDAVARELSEAGHPMSALDIAERVAISRVTARRYLEHLVEIGTATRAPRYGSPGRPEFEYSWRGWTPPRTPRASPMT